MFQDNLTSPKAMPLFLQLLFLTLHIAPFVSHRIQIWRQLKFMCHGKGDLVIGEKLLK